MKECIICNRTGSKLKLTVDNFKIVKCKQCGFVYLQNPLPFEDDLNTYDQYFKQSLITPYEKNTSNLAMKILWQLNEQRLRWINKIKPDGSLLDIGSGRGYFLYHAFLTGYEVVEGIEISPLAAKYCQKYYHIHTAIQNIENGFSSDSKYDIITMWHVLEHFHNPLKVLINLKEQLTDNGILFIEVPNVNNLKFLLSPKGKKWEGGNHPRHHRFFFSHRTISLLLSKAGFTNVKNITAVYNLSHHKKMKTWFKQGLKWINMDSFITVYAIK